jgi:hypothetical protein
MTLLFQILSPFHGAVLSRVNGKETSAGLEITVQGLAEPFVDVKVNGQPASRSGETFSTRVTLSQKENNLVAETHGFDGTIRHSIRVLWDKQSFRRYDFFIDDNVFFFEDLVKNAHASLFDCLYLAELRRLHREYGAKFTLNSFYRNDHGDGKFNLSAFPDKYKGEFLDNSDWLKLAFHAYSEFPDRPYQYATPEKLAADYDITTAELIRVAGEKTVTPPIVIHWAMAQPPALRELRKRGVRFLSGQYVNSRTGVGDPGEKNNAPDIGYFVDHIRAARLVAHKMVHDFDLDITFVKTGAACSNLDTCEKTLRKLEAAYANPETNEVIGLATHEQYSFPHYFNYIPDHFKRMETGVRWLTEHGYAPVFFQEGFLGNRAWEQEQ